MKFEEIKSNPKFHDLSEVMDYNREFSIFFSGVENRTFLDHLYNMGIRNFLVSYEYVKKRTSGNLMGYDDIHLFVDSGVFTYLTNDPDDTYKNRTVEEWEVQIVEYLNWAKTHKDKIFAIADLDLQYLVGVEQVKAWRKKYFEPFMLETGVPVCFIYHEEGLDEWEYMCKRYPYVGLSINTGKGQSDESDLVQLYRIAEKHGTLVQGMGLTNTKILQKYGFYTVDSSVARDSRIMVKDTHLDLTHHTTIGEFFNKFGEGEKTADHERIHDLNNGRYKVLTSNDDNEVIWGDLNAVVKHKVRKEMATLYLEGGTSLTATSDHSLILMNEEGDLYEEKPSNLKVGDYVLSPSRYDIGNNPVREVMVRIPTKNRPDVEEELVIKLTDDFLRFLGLWVGDGHLGSGGYVGMSCGNDPEVFDTMVRALETFGTYPTIKDNGVDCSIHSVTLSRAIQSLGFVSGSTNKTVPDFIFSLPEYSICRFLEGYFSADGTGTCECSTVSEELAHGIVELLSMMGIYTSMSSRSARTFEKNDKEYKASKIWHVTIRDGESKEKFRSLIGFIQKYKNETLSEAIDSCNTVRGARRRGIPKELIVTNKGYIVDHKGRNQTLTSTKGRVNRGYKTGLSERVVNSEFDFVRINKIEKFTPEEEIDVYDLSVDKYERFVANGVLVHNTTWNVGLQFGELNVWNNDRMMRVRKEDLERRAKPITDMYNLNPPVDYELFREGDYGELIRPNAHAMLLAQEYIKERNKGLSYWLKAKSTKRNLDNLENTFPIPMSWFMGDMKGMGEKAELLNVNPEIPPKDMRPLLKTMAGLIMQDVAKFNPLTVAVLKEEAYIDALHDLYVNRIVHSDEEKISDLREFFEACYVGDNETLLQQGTNFDRIAKERETYIEDDVDELVDIPESEVRERVKAIMPTESDLIDDESDILDLDKEIYDQANIVPVFDEKGLFVKGQQKIRKPKKVYSNKYPKYVCDTCPAAQRCPEYKAGYVCAFQKTFEKFDSRDVADVLDGMQGIVNHNMGRMQREMLIEVMSGINSPIVSQLMDVNMKYLDMMGKMYESGSAEVMRQTRVLRADGTQEESMSVTNPKKGGVLEQLFAKQAKRDEKEEEDDQNQ